jgi:flagellin
MSAVAASGYLNQATGNLSKNTEKLSSGYRINRAADDAAGLSISEKMRTQIRGLNRASANAQDGISYIQTAEGALNEVHSLLQRSRELSVQAANDTNTDTDRQALQDEIDALSKEVDRISIATQFNTMNVFDTTNVGSTNMVGNAGNGISVNSIDAGEVGFVTYDSNIQLGSDVLTYDMDFTDAINQAAGYSKTFTEAGLESFANNLKNTVLPNILSSITQALPSSTPTISGLQMGLYMYASNDGTLAYVSSNGQKYQLGVNLYYLTENNGNISSTSTSLDTTITHELMHGIMFDTVTNGMLGTQGASSFPQWFTEGMAQAVGGGFDYTRSKLKSTFSDSEISNWLSDLNTDTYSNYSQGYVASMYLGYVANGGTGAVTSASIANGLNTILQDIQDGYSLSQAIYMESNGTYSDLSDFENKFSTDAVGFTKDLMTAVGSGDGSVVAASLSADSSTISASMGTGNGNFFTLDPDNTWAVNTVPNAYTGGGGTSTPGTDRSGNVNPNASTTWGSGSASGSGSGSGSGGGPSTGTAAASVLHLQVGSLSGQSIDLNTFKLSASDLGINGLDVGSFESAGDAIDKIDKAIDSVSDMRSYYGAIQNRLEHTITNLDTTSENTQSAESQIRDTDMADTMVAYSKNNILQQAGQTILAQANQQTQGVLNLLA